MIKTCLSQLDSKFFPILISGRRDGCGINHYQLFYQKTWRKPRKVKVTDRGGEGLGVRGIDINWKRTSVGNKPVLSFKLGHEHQYCCYWGGIFEEEKKQCRWGDNMIVWKNEVNYEKHEEEHRLHDQEREEERKLSKIVSSYYYPILDHVREIHRTEILDEFLEDHAEEEAPHHKKELDHELENRISNSDDLLFLVQTLVENGYPLEGVTVAEAKQVATGSFWSVRERREKEIEIDPRYDKLVFRRQAEEEADDS